MVVGLENIGVLWGGVENLGTEDRICIVCVSEATAHGAWDFDCRYFGREGSWK